jgi:hypothetical protein
MDKYKRIWLLKADVQNKGSYIDFKIECTTSKILYPATISEGVSHVGSGFGVSVEWLIFKKNDAFRFEISDVPHLSLDYINLERSVDASKAMVAISKRLTNENGRSLDNLHPLRVLSLLRRGFLEVVMDYRSGMYMPLKHIVDPSLKRYAVSHPEINNWYEYPLFYYANSKEEAMRKYAEHLLKEENWDRMALLKDPSKTTIEESSYYHEYEMLDTLGLYRKHFGEDGNVAEYLNVPAQPEELVELEDENA